MEEVTIRQTHLRETTSFIRIIITITITITITIVIIMIIIIGPTKTLTSGNRKLRTEKKLDGYKKVMFPTCGVLNNQTI